MPSELITELRPILIQRWVGAFSDDEYRAVLRETSECLKKDAAGKRRNAMVVDLRLAEQLTTEQRKLLSTWLNENETLVREVCVGTAFVVRSPMVRAVLATVLWIQSHPGPHTVVSRMQNGLEWCTDLLRRADVAVPEGLRSCPYARWLTDMGGKFGGGEPPSSHL